MHGCVPVYLGTLGAAAAFPSDCLVDADRFADDAALLAHLRAIDAPRFAAMQAAIAAFLRSSAAQRFSREYFARTLVAGIAADQGLTPLAPAA